MAPRTKKQFEIIRENRKKSIIQTAMKLFAENGFESISVSTIAKKSGISKGLMYNYFESKETLLKEIIIAGVNEMISPTKALTKQEITQYLTIK